MVVVVVAGRRGEEGSGGGIFLSFHARLRICQDPRIRNKGPSRWSASSRVGSRQSFVVCTLRLPISQRAIAPSSKNVVRTRDSLMTARFAWRHSPWCASARSS